MDDDDADDASSSCILFGNICVAVVKSLENTGVCVCLFVSNKHMYLHINVLCQSFIVVSSLSLLRVHYF